MEKIERFAWSALIKKGKAEEYIKRHNNLWPEMKKVLKEAGITNYSIWLKENEVFGYYECKKGIKFAMQIQNKSPIVKKWNKYMSDILIMKHSKNAQQPKLEKIFYLK